MKIMISNDDGYSSPGIHALAAALDSIEETEIYICAPEKQQSGQSHSLTMDRKLFVKREQAEHAAEAVTVSGTPADCVMIGLDYFAAKGIVIDMVFSGINIGSNLGSDTIYSGTVGAAMEGALKGIPSTAVSVTAEKPRTFECAAELAKKAYYIVKEKMDPSVILNINAPDVPHEEIKGVLVTHTAVRDYEEWFVPDENSDPEGYVFSGRHIALECGSCDMSVDMAAIENGYASVTPLRYDLTHYDEIDTYKKFDWEIL